MVKNTQNPIEYKKGLIYFVYIFIILFTVGLTFFSYILKSEIDASMDEIQYKEGVIVHSTAGQLGYQFDIILADLNFLKQQYERGANLPEELDELDEEWSIFSENRGIYDQIRFINQDGDEKIRINYIDHHAVIVDDSKLQNKKDRYYFTETENLKPDQIYISKIDLNIENNQIEQPIKPMIRFCTPVFDATGQFVGMVVLNYLAQQMIDEFQFNEEGGFGKLYLLNDDGYWIYSGDPDQEWSFMYEDKKNISFKNFFPVEWDIIKDREGTLKSDAGFFTFSDVVLHDQGVIGAGLSADNIILGEGDLKIVSFIDREGSYSDLFLKVFSIEFLIKVILDNAMYFILILVISFISASFLYWRRSLDFEVKYLSEHDDLTNVFNRRAGLALLNENLSGAESRKSKFSLCYIDINGLKDVNDSLGHVSGDELILTIVESIKNIIRHNDFIIRMGGDEFLIIFNDSNMVETEGVWSRITDEFNRINETQQRPYLISASHGIVEFEKTERDTLDQLIVEADEKMYLEKKGLKEKLVIVRKSSAR